MLKKYFLQLRMLAYKLKSSKWFCITIFLFTVNVTNFPNSYWLGLKRNLNGTFQWADMSFLDSYNFWNNGDGSNLHEKCAIIGFPLHNISNSNPLRWYDVDCAGPHKNPSGYICQRSAGYVNVQLHL